MNRPQFFFETPPGFKDIPFVRPVTYGQDSSGGIPAQSYLNNYIVQMDNDAPQIIRSLFWQGQQQGQGAGPLSGSVQIQLRDAFGNYLTDGYVPIWLYFWGAGSTPPDGGSGRCRPFESELYCPPGSVLTIDYFNPSSSATAYQYPGLMEFRGVKRLPESCQ